VFLYYDVPLVDKYAIHSKHGKNSSTKKKEREKYIVFHHDSSLHKPNMVILPTKQNPGKKSNAKHAKHQIVPLGLAQAIIDSNRKGTEFDPSVEWWPMCQENKECPTTQERTKNKLRQSRKTGKVNQSICE
jgi:hypothetical protein